VVRALNVLLSDRGIKQRSVELSKKMDSSGALASACNLIEGLCRDTQAEVSDRLRTTP